MRQGFRVIDSDTHVNPSLDVLLRYADRELARADRRPAALSADGQDGRRPGRRRGRGHLHDPVGQAGSPAARGRPEARRRRRGRPAIAAFSRGARRWSRASPITPRVAEDNARAGCATWTSKAATSTSSFPGPWAYGAPALAPHLAHGLYRAYHRYMAEYCAADSRRLKSMVLALATDPSVERAGDQGARPRGLGGGGVAAAARGDADRRSRSRADLGGRRRGRSADHVPRVHHRDAVLPGLSRHLGQPRDGPLRRPDLGRPAVSLLHADGRDARPLSPAARRRAGERPRLAAALARAPHATDRLRARLGVARRSSTRPLEYAQMGRVFVQHRLYPKAWR